MERWQALNAEVRQNKMELLGRLMGARSQDSLAE